MRASTWERAMAAKARFYKSGNRADYCEWADLVYRWSLMH